MIRITQRHPVEKRPRCPAYLDNVKWVGLREVAVAISLYLLLPLMETLLQSCKFCLFIVFADVVVAVFAGH